MTMMTTVRVRATYLFGSLIIYLCGYFPGNQALQFTRSRGKRCSSGKVTILFHTSYIYDHPLKQRWKLSLKKFRFVQESTHDASDTDAVLYQMGADHFVAECGYMKIIYLKHSYLQQLYLHNNIK